MREIKFRAFDKVNKRMLYNIQNEYDGDEQCFGSYLNMTDFYEVMEYTGVKDHNNKEIYEGDIVKVVKTDFVDDYEYEYEEGKYIIKFSFDRFYLENCSNGEIQEFKDAIGDYSYIEVIGNIYDNLELLEEQK